MKGWYAVASALLFFPGALSAADDLSGAARELARKTAAFVGKGAPVSLVWRSLSATSSAELAAAREHFESELRDRGARPGEIAPAAEGRITLSGNAAQDLLIEEIRKGDEVQVWIAGWTRIPPPAAAKALNLERKLLWESDEPILDVLISPETLVALTPARIVWLQDQSSKWTPAASADLPAHVSPRDPRGRIRPSEAGFLAALPGLECRGSLTPGSSLECESPGKPWPVESGSHRVLLAAFVPGRNFLEARFVTQTGTRRTAAPFFSAASVEQPGKTFWLFATLDGRVQLTGAALEPLAFIPSWGSDIAGISAGCAGGSQVLATRPGESGSPDALQPFALSGLEAVPLGPALDFPGPIRALWPASGATAIAVAQDPGTGKYAAYLVTVACGS